MVPAWVALEQTSRGPDFRCGRLSIGTQKTCARAYEGVGPLESEVEKNPT